MATSFVNREAELELINDALKALTDGKSLLRTPIIDFYGVEGMGKTSLLREVEQRCRNNYIRYIWINGEESFLERLTQQIQKKYRPKLQHDDESFFHQSISATKALLNDGPFVLLLDAVNVTNEKQVRLLETMLRDLLEENTLFVVVSSKRMLTFERERSVARKLTPIQVKPLDQNNSGRYLASFGNQLEPQKHKIIFDWTHGYPSAMNAMAHAIINDKLDPEEPSQQRQVMQVIVEQVVNQGILSKVAASNRQWYISALTLLSMPRRFNLVLLQDLIEEFSPELKLESSLAYIRLPKQIQEETDVLKWNMQRAGFSVDSPVRNIFLLRQKIEDLEHYREIHRFLADINKRFANDVSGSDRVRYLIEYLYHNAQVGNEQHLTLVLEQIMQTIADKPDDLLHFSEEFSQDEELKMLLGAFANVVLSRIHRRMAEMSKRAAEESTGNEHFKALKDFFIHIMEDPENTTLTLDLQDSLKEVIQEEPPVVSTQLLQELSHDERFTKVLGPGLEELSRLITSKLLEKDEQL